MELKPADSLSHEEWSRYQRHIQLPGFNKDAQVALKNAKVLIVGAGGLGCPILLYLAACGVGVLGIADFDIIEIENLHRQILFTHEDIGKSKALTAGRKIKNLHPFTSIRIINTSIDYQNVQSVISEYDVIVDGTDNFGTRYLLNDACVLYQKPYIYGALFRFEGQVSSFNIPLPNGTRSCNYRNIYPVPPDIGTIPTCAEGGVLGILPGIVGSVQALEVIKLITGVGSLMMNKTWIFDSLTMESRIIRISNSDPFPITEITPLPDYCIPGPVSEISFDEITQKDTAHYQLIDVRTDEERKNSHLGGLHIPLILLKDHIKDLIANEKTIIFYCQSGRRSKEAVQIIQQYTEGKIRCLSLRGGLSGVEKH